MKNFNKKETKSDIDILLEQIEFFLKYSFIFLLIFSSSFLVGDYLHYSENNNNKTDTFFLTKSEVNENNYYVIFKNTDPDIKEIELFIAKNKNNLSEKDMKEIEDIRLKKITEIMAKKYLSIIN